MRIADYKICNSCFHRLDENNRIVLTKQKPTKCEKCYKKPKQEYLIDPYDVYKEPKNETR